MGSSSVGYARRATGLDVNRDIIAAIGDVGLFASGTNVLQAGGGAVIKSPDPSAARRLVTKIGALIARQGRRSGVSVGRAAIAGARGIRIRSRRLPGAINVVTRGNRLVAAYGESNARSMSQSLTSAMTAIIENCGGDLSLSKADNITCPVLLITGEHDMFAPPALLSQPAARIRNVEVQVVKDAGHDVHNARPEWMAQTLLDWLKKH